MEYTLDIKRVGFLTWLLRIGCAGCFIGHGAFGIIGKVGWLPYFAVVGICPDWAWPLMRVVGIVDIVAGISILFTIQKPVLIYMAIWGLWTAILRPLSGESFWETIERAGNYGVPIALLLFIGANFDWKKLYLPTMRMIAPNFLAWVLRISTSMLLFGHGALMVNAKPLLLQHGSIVGLAPNAVQWLGGFEIILAVFVLVSTWSTLFFLIFIWKLTTEFFFILAGAPAWEFVERAGNYVAPLCLAYLLFCAAAINPPSTSTATTQSQKT